MNSQIFFFFLSTWSLFFLLIGLLNLKQLFFYTFQVEQIIEYITKTCPCNVYPLEPHFYIGKLGYVGVYLFFLFLLQNIDCGYSLEPPHRGGGEAVLTCIHNL